VVNAPWPVAVTGFCSGAYGKIVNCMFELCSEVMPERAISCCPDIEYLLVGGRDGRDAGRPIFMWYDWMVAGWGGRNGKDGANCTSAIFGVGEAVQPCEGQERLAPILTTRHEILTDSGGPGRWRGGCGVVKGGSLGDAEDTVMSYCCDRARSVTWGLRGGLPSIPHGAWLNPGRREGRWLGAIFSNLPVKAGDSFERPSAGGGGFGDPLERAPEAVLEDVIDGYVSVERAARDYGVVVEVVDADVDDLRVDLEATSRERARQRRERRAWLAADPEDVAKRYRAGELDMLDLVRRYGVILDWQTGELLPNSTATFRSMLGRRSAAHWG
jgi:N-methylhydantoinase B